MSGRLPASIEQLRGRRSARWIRESTAGQYDRFGPAAQRELQDASIRRLGLVDTGLSWEPAQSGRTVHASAQMRAMLDAAIAGEFEVLLVAYVARWQRNLRRVLELLEDELHPAGVAVWFCDEEILSSADRHWDQLVDEAKAAESWLRKHRRRVREGYAAKLATRHDPGGRAPFGFRRDPVSKLLEPNPGQAGVVAQVYSFAAARMTDRDVSAQIGLGLYTVRGILTSPLYAGRLRTGEPGHWQPLVDPELWEQVQAVRARRRTRDGRAAKRRPYALSMLRCAACDRRLTGDTGRYRHTDACEAFTAVRREPRRRIRGQRKAMPGNSYRADDYEAIVLEVLQRVSLGADRVARLVEATRSPEPDRLALGRIARERDGAMARYRRDRDPAALEATMVALDRQEVAIRAAQDVDAQPAADVVAYLRDLPRWWAEAPASRRGLAEALFERIEVLGLRQMHLEPTQLAIRAGLVEAFASSSAGYGRGERTGARANQQIAGCRITMGGPSPRPHPLERSA